MVHILLSNVVINKIIGGPQQYSKYVVTYSDLAHIPTLNDDNFNFFNLKGDVNGDGRVDVVFTGDGSMMV